MLKSKRKYIVDGVGEFDILLRKETGSRWRFLHPNDAFDALREQFHAYGLTFIEPEYTQQRGIYTAQWTVIGRAFGHSDEFSSKLCVIMSTNQRASFRVYGGKVVLLCANGVVSPESELIYRHKHTTGLSIPAVAKSWIDDQLRVTSFINTLKDMVLDRGTASYLLLSAFELDLISPSRMRLVSSRAIEYPAITGWTLYNLVTEQFDAFRPATQPRKLLRLSSLFVRARPELF